MTNVTHKSGVLTAVMLCSAAIGLYVAPSAKTASIRTGLRDAVLPGQLLLKSAVEQLGRSTHKIVISEHSQDELDALETNLDAWKQRYRALQVENLLLREKLSRAEREGIFPYRGSSGRPLIVPDLLQASVLGEETAALWRAGKLLDKGAADGVAESSLVLEDTNPMLDQGGDVGLKTGQPVYSGRCVVGRIARVGRWSSTFQLVTDHNYSGLAQLARTTTRGTVFGARGFLKGRDQPLCRLEEISHTEAVQVGDDVYTANRDGPFPYPMYYGQVVKAELKLGAPRWEIWVRPALHEIDLRTVHVLRTKLNPLRIADHQERLPIAGIANQRD